MPGRPFFATHRALKIAGLALAALIVLGIIGNLTKKKTTAVATKAAPTTIVATTAAPPTTRAPAPTTTKSAPTTTTRPAPTTAKPKTVGTKLDTDANQVANNVLLVQAAVQSATASPTQAAVNQLAQTAQFAHDTISNLRSAIAIDGGTGAADLYGAADDLKNSMGALVAYTGNPNPATLAHFTSQYNTAVTNWNVAVRAHYAGTSQTPPTIITA